MSEPRYDGRQNNPLARFRRKQVSCSQFEWVKAEHLGKDSGGPMLLSPVVDGIDLQSWATNNRSLIEESLSKSGALLFRGFAVDSVIKFEQFIHAVSDEALAYRERSSPRHLVSGDIYTSTDYPADQSIYFHNENSYQQSWPMKLFFMCRVAPEQGGETPLADSRRVLACLSPSTRARFREKKCMYIRNFDSKFGLPWQTVFQTEDPQKAEQYCRQSGIAYKWTGDGSLRTVAVRPAITTHPKTGEEIWFNHVAFFHISTLSLALREGLLQALGEDSLPANTYYGDGSQIEPAVLDEIRDAYGKQSFSFEWKKGDLLMIDNMLVAHSRTPFKGPREILVGMADSSDRLQTNFE